MLFGIVMCLGLYMANAHMKPEGCQSKGTSYDCSNRNLTDFPPSLPDNMTSLDMSGNLLTELKFDALSKYTKLQNLTLDANKIAHVNASAFDGCTSLKHLSLCHNDVTELPDLVFNNTPLETLKLAHNAFKAIPEGSFTPLKNLLYLDLTSLNGDQGLTNVTGFVLGDAFSGMHLQFLSLGGLGLMDISRAFANVNPNLNELDLAINKIETIDGAFSSFKTLSSLSLANNNIHAIGDDDVKGLGSLKKLNLNDNRISDIKSSVFGNLVKLETLDLRGFLGTVIPDDVFTKCQALSEISLSNTLITSTGSAFANLANLKVLDLSNNANLRGFGDNAFTNDTSLSALYLHGMATKTSVYFYQLHEAIRTLQNLSSLDVSFSHFVTFSKADLAFFNKTKQLKADLNPYDCACRNSEFITWFQKSPSVIPKSDRPNYMCMTCDQCSALPTSLSNFSMGHCHPQPTVKPTTKPSEGKSVVNYAVGMAFLGLAVGVILTSLVVVFMLRGRRGCFKNTYTNMAGSTGEM